MSKPEWNRIDSGGVLYRAQYSTDFGSACCLLVKLTEHSYLVYSPGPGLIESAMNILNQDSELILLAPSAGHTLGLKPWKSQFKNARVVAAESARERINKKTSISELDTPASIANELPKHVSLHQAPGKNLSEIWLSVDLDGKVYWAVCDAFMNLPTIDGSFISRILKRLYSLKPGLRFHKIFRLGIKNKPEFRDWALRLFSNRQISVLIPCHGDIYAEPDCSDRIIGILKENF